MAKKISVRTFYAKGIENTPKNLKDLSRCFKN